MVTWVGFGRDEVTVAVIGVPWEGAGAARAVATRATTTDRIASILIELSTRNLRVEKYKVEKSQVGKRSTLLIQFLGPDDPFISFL